MDGMGGRERALRLISSWLRFDEIAKLRHAKHSWWVSVLTTMDFLGSNLCQGVDESVEVFRVLRLCARRCGNHSGGLMDVNFVIPGMFVKFLCIVPYPKAGYDPV